MEPIEPCPFCGKPPGLVYLPSYVAICSNKECPVRPGWGAVKTYGTRKLAIAAWNRRARTPLETELVKGIGSCLWVLNNHHNAGTPQFEKFALAAIKDAEAVLAKANAATGGGVG